MMSQFDINIKMNDDYHVITKATIPSGIEPDKLLYGLWCHIQLIADHLHEDKKKIIFMALTVNQFIEQSGGLLDKTNKVHVILPKELNLSGKEEQ